MQRLHLFWVSFFVAPFLASGLIKYPTHILNLTDFLLYEYDMNVRPVIDSTTPVVVEHELLLKQILKLNTKTQILSLFINEYTTWVDPYLTWDPVGFNNISYMHFSRDRIWIPDVIVFNQVHVILLTVLLHSAEKTKK